MTYFQMVDACLFQNEPSDGIWFCFVFIDLIFVQTLELKRTRIVQGLILEDLHFYLLTRIHHCIKKAVKEISAKLCCWVLYCWSGIVVVTKFLFLK